LDKGLIKIALQSIAFYEGSKHQISKESIRSQDFKSLFKKLMENVETDQRIDMQALWILHERLVSLGNIQRGVKSTLRLLSLGASQR
jgi:hypothetical protein